MIFRIKAFILNLIEKIGNCASAPEDSVQLRINKKLICILAFLVTISGALWGVMYLLLGFYLPTVFPFLYSLIIGIALFQFRKNKNYEKFVKIQLGMMLLLPFSLQWSLGGFSQSGVVMVWAILAPFGSLIFQDNKKAITIFITYIFLIFLSVFQDIYFPGPDIPIEIKILFFITNISVVSILSFFAMLYFVNVSKKEYTREAVLAQQKEIIESQKRLTASYARFVPTEFISFLKKDSIEETDLGDFMEDELTVLFSDIRGFTTISEKMSSNELMNFLNSYLTEITPIVKENDGIIDKFIGDAIMAIFPQSPLNALYSSIQFINKIRDLNKTNELFARNQINIGIGMHTGHMTMGTIGSKQRMNTTVVGDAVNLASRIESLTKVFHVPILISEQFYNHLPEDEREFVREIDITSVKGKNYPVKIYEVFASDPPDVLIKKMELKKELEKAVHTFREGDYNSAKDLFIKCQKVCPEDPIPVIYINRCETLRIEKSTKVIQSIDQLKNKPKSVLIIDDNVALLELMQYKIRKNKFYVLNASNGKEAVLKYEQFNPEIVLTDLYMPDMDGLEVSEKIMAIAHLRKENPKIIFITSEESEEVKNQILNKGYEFLPKPIDFKELFNKIQ